MAEGVGFEPTVALRLLLISSQMPLTTQPPFQPRIFGASLVSNNCVLASAILNRYTPSSVYFSRICVRGKLIRRWKRKNGRISSETLPL